MSTRVARTLGFTSACTTGVWCLLLSQRLNLTKILCNLDPALYACLQDVDFRREDFTATEQVMLCARLDLPAPNTDAIAALRRDAATFKANQKKGRDSRFKSDVLGGYYFTCALTGYRLDTETTSIVQAAHIHQHAVSGNDDPRNGLALTPDAHWMFDDGLWTVIPNGDDWLIHVAIGRFSESSPHGRLLSGFHGHQLSFHAHARLRPDAKHFEWHRKTHRI